MSRDSTVIPFRQPDAIDDPLTELAREGNRLINAQAANGDTAISAMVQEAALAVIPARLAVRAPIGDMQLPAAMSAAQETGQQRLAAADRSTRHVLLALSAIRR